MSTNAVTYRFPVLRMLIAPTQMALIPAPVMMDIVVMVTSMGHAKILMNAKNFWMNVTKMPHVSIMPMGHTIVSVMKDTVVMVSTAQVTVLLFFFDYVVSIWLVRFKYRTNKFCVHFLFTILFFSVDTLSGLSFSLHCFIFPQ